MMSEMEVEQELELFQQVRPMKAKSQNRKVDFAREAGSWQPGSHAGSYRRRWKVERTFSSCSALPATGRPYDRSITIYEAVFHISCLMIVLRTIEK